MLQNLWMVEPSLDVPLTSWWLSLGWEPASNQVQGEPKISDQLEKFTKNLFHFWQLFKIEFKDVKRNRRIKYL